MDADTQITPGREYTPYLATADLNKNKLVQDLINLRESTNEQDVLKYISSGQVINNLEKVGLFSINQFTQDLGKITGDSSKSLRIRKQALFEILLLQQNVDMYWVTKNFSTIEKEQVTSEIKQWAKSSDKRKRNFYSDIIGRWTDAIVSGNIATLQGLSELNLVDVNQRNTSGYSAAVIAANVGQKAVIEWLAKNPKLDFAAKDAYGYTDVENIRLLGRKDMADLIARLRPETSGQRQFDVKERNADGTPKIAFAKIPAGKFMMGEGDNRVLVEITKPFEFMSVDTTQDVWEKIAKLAIKTFKGIVASDPIYANGINATPSRFKGKNLPVEQVSFNDVETWLRFLNRLSKMDDPAVQATLGELFPGHKKGAEYGLPTEYQYEYVARNLGLGEGLEYSHGNSEESLKEEAWYSANSGSKTQPVGAKKPTMILGQPIYDIRGNVWKWMANWYDGTLVGGVDPTGPTSGSFRVIRGGSWLDGASFARSALRNRVDPSNRVTLGFRLLRTSP